MLFGALRVTLFRAMKEILLRPPFFAIGAITPGATAQDAVQQNAALSTTVQSALTAALGVNGNTQTVSPRYKNWRPSQGSMGLPSA